MARPPQRHVTITKIEGADVYWVWHVNDLNNGSYAEGKSFTVQQALREAGKVIRKPSKYAWVKIVDKCSECGGTDGRHFMDRCPSVK